MDRKRVITLVVLHLVYWITVGFVILLITSTDDAYPKDKFLYGVVAFLMMMTLYINSILQNKRIAAISWIIFLIFLFYANANIDHSVRSKVLFDSQQCLAVVFDQRAEALELPQGNWVTHNLEYILETTFERKITQIIGDCHIQDLRTIHGS